ncbi:MAG: TetR family transcriptional regulator [Chloroflexi bacterium]|nr:TetR family transcriptional regulator [Chloroflexota bacterium]
MDAARRVLAERGYAGATVAAIAQAANVAVPTVYASVGGKSAILAAFQERIDEDIGASGALQAVLTASDPTEVLRIAVELTRRIAELFGDIQHILESAAPADADVAAALAEGVRRHRRGLRQIAQRLVDLHALRPGLSVDDAGDTLAVLTLWRTWHTMVVDFGWSWQVAEDWVRQAASRALLVTEEHP